jgi:hypothetical protein
MALVVMGLILSGCADIAEQRRVMFKNFEDDVARQRVELEHARAESVRSEAARAFSCPPDQVETRAVDDGAYTAAGCGRDAVFVAPLFNGPAETPIVRASFDLSCPAPELKMTYLGNRSIGVDGCGKKASYAWVGHAWVGSAAP